MIQRESPPSGDLGLVSVLVPTHNRAALVVKALDSVHEQSYRPIELVIVDDGSTDDTADVLREWSESHATDGLDVVRLEGEGRGAAAARNAGIARATGSWIAFLDSDDRWEPSKLEVFARAIRANPRYGLWYSSVRWIDADGEVARPVPSGFSGDHTARLRTRHPICGMSSVLVRRALLEEIGGLDERLPARHDVDLYFRLADRTEFGFIPDVLVNYNTASIDRISSCSKRRMLGWILFYRKHKKDLSVVERGYHHKRILYYALKERDIPSVIRYGPGGIVHALLGKLLDRITRVDRSTAVTSIPAP